MSVHFGHTPDRILNLDKSPNVVAATGVKQVGQVVTAERGTLVTMCGIVSATGNTVPPVFIFLVQDFITMLTGAPPGSLGLVKFR